MIQFPVINISNPNFSKEEDLTSFLLMDGFIYNNTEVYFQEYLKDNLFCDCDGKIFKITGKRHSKSIFRKVFFFLPNIYKIELIFEATNEYLTLDDLRDFMIERVKSLGYGKFEVKWILELRKAKSYEELILGKQN
ncbi:hypothetical protein INR75_10020 [Zunongwangia sp. SCSIO 43204]|uniref:hypothetical protein n=1 Tax=Zunongwangia sp. SCSIO 43204 TaxID=2779359 RepID=UPI001CA94001|nr:hypothetical protein [Zunongwangia sp. SCSIO 43204]UAB86302.1 hypothetical protein INR75_10020 [Zunongwangia sp. SCSIO 43204]